MGHDVILSAALRRSTALLFFSDFPVCSVHTSCNASHSKRSALHYCELDARAGANWPRFQSRCGEYNIIYGSMVYIIIIKNGNHQTHQLVLWSACFLSLMFFSNTRVSYTVDFGLRNHATFGSLSLLSFQLGASPRTSRV